MIGFSIISYLKNVFELDIQVLEGEPDVRTVLVGSRK